MEQATGDPYLAGRPGRLDERRLHMNIPDDVERWHGCRRRFAHLFQGAGRLEIYRGWIEPLMKLCADVEVALAEQGRAGRFVQIKEKFGACDIRFVVLPSAITSADDRSAQAMKLLADVENKIDATRALTSTMCMVCGASAAIPTDSPRRLCLCVSHRALTRHPTPWEAAHIDG